MNSKLNIIFSESGCPADGVLQKYLNGELSHSQKHDVEKHLIDCEMCSDELEGLQLMQDSEKLNLIVDRINDKIDHKTKVRILKPLFTFARIAAAVLIFVIIGSLYILYNNFNSLKNDKVLSENIKQVTTAEQPQKDEPKIGEGFKADSTPKGEINASTRKVIADNNQKNIETTKDLLSKLSFAEKKEVEKVSEIGLIEDSENKASTGNNVGGATIAYFDALANNRNESEIALEESKPIEDEKLKEESITENTVTLSGKTAATKSDEIAMFTSNTAYKSDRKGEKKAKSQSTDSYAGLPATSDDSDKSKDSDLEQSPGYSAPNASNITISASQESERERLKNNASGEESLLNLAIDDYSTERYNDARSKLEQVITNKSFSYYQKAQWYYALTLVKLNDIPKAKTVLNDIVKIPNHIYNKEAKEKLIELGE